MILRSINKRELLLTQNQYQNSLLSIFIRMRAFKCTLRTHLILDSRSIFREAFSKVRKTGTFFLGKKLKQKYPKILEHLF